VCEKALTGVTGQSRFLAKKYCDAFALLSVP
jgi:hypothetical protein